MYVLYFVFSEVKLTSPSFHLQNCTDLDAKVTSMRNDLLVGDYAQGQYTPTLFGCGGLVHESDAPCGDGSSSLLCRTVQVCYSFLPWEGLPGFCSHR